LDFEIRRQLFKMGFARLESDPFRFREEVVRGAKIVKALEASLVIDSVVPAVEALGRERSSISSGISSPQASTSTAPPCGTSQIGYRALKVVRSGERVMAAGYGLLLEMDISELVASVGGVRLGGYWTSSGVRERSRKCLRLRPSRRLM
jgi:hypothetical protein